VKKMLVGKALSGGSDTAPKGLRGSAVGALENLFPDDTNEEQVEKRHRLTQYFFHKPHSKYWRGGEASALLKWATVDGKVQDDFAMQEAAAIMDMLDKLPEERRPEVEDEAPLDSDDLPY